MKTLTCWNDLREFGIDGLTGEACTYSLRLLCDVNHRGAEILCELFGLPPGTKLAENWNSGSGNKSPSIGSVMLPYSLFIDVAAFCLFVDGATTVLVDETGRIRGFYATEDDAEQLKECREFAGDQIKRVLTPMGGPRAGSRMVHQMSGRAT